MYDSQILAEKSGNSDGKIISAYRYDPLPSFGPPGWRKTKKDTYSVQDLFIGGSNQFKNPVLARGKFDDLAAYLLENMELKVEITANTGSSENTSRYTGENTNYEEGTIVFGSVYYTRGDSDENLSTIGGLMDLRNEKVVEELTRRNISRDRIVEVHRGTYENDNANRRTDIKTVK